MQFAMAGIAQKTTNGLVCAAQGVVGVMRERDYNKNVKSKDKKNPKQAQCLFRSGRLLRGFDERTTIPQIYIE